MNDSTHSREHFRLRYPLQARPRFVMNGTEFTVTEISEGGCRVLYDDIGESTQFNNSPKVTFSFHDKTVVKSAATFIRIADEEVVLKLIPPIPLPVIIAEQQWVIRKFPIESQKTDI